MALVRCSDCGNDRSDQAPACPHCGRPNPPGYVPRAEHGTAPRGVRIFWGFIGLVAITFVAMIGVGSSSAPRAATPPVPAGPSDADYRVLAEERVRAALRDPQSAQFEGETVVRNATGVAVCGTVNARNGFGGYAGANGFVMTALGLVMRSARNDAAFVKLWNRACVIRQQ